MAGYAKYKIWVCKFKFMIQVFYYRNEIKYMLFYIPSFECLWPPLSADIAASLDEWITELIVSFIKWNIALNQFLGFMKKVLFAGRITPYKNGWINKDCFDWRIYTQNAGGDSHFLSIISMNKEKKPKQIFPFS